MFHWFIEKIRLRGHTIVYRDTELPFRLLEWRWASTGATIFAEYELHAYYGYSSSDAPVGFLIRSQ